MKKNQDFGAWPDGTARRWPDGTDRSWGNGFTHGMSERPHGYVLGAEVLPTQPRRKRGPRSQLAFGQPNGTIAGMGMDPGVRRVSHLHRPQHAKKATREDEPA